MRKKVLFLFTLMVALFATVTMTIQPTYAFESVTSEHDLSYTTVKTDTAGNPAGVRLSNADDFQGKNILIGMRLETFVSADNIVLKYIYESQPRTYTLNETAMGILASEVAYDENNNIEISFQWPASGVTYFEVYIMHYDENSDSVSDLPIGLTIDNIDDWFYVTSSDITLAPKYPFVVNDSKQLTYLDTTSYSDIYNFWDNKLDVFGTNGTDDLIDKSTLYFNVPEQTLNIAKGISGDDGVNQQEVYFEYGYDSTHVVRHYVDLDLKSEETEVMYPTLNIGSESYLPGSMISVEGWDISDTQNIKTLLSNEFSMGHENSNINSDTDFVYSVESDVVDWNTTIGTYPILIKQVEGSNIYTWTLFVTLDETITDTSTVDDTSTVAETAPEIEGEDTVEFLTKDFSLLMLKAQYDLSDEEDVDALLSLDIKEEGTTLPEKDFTDGTYTVILTCEDSDGNITEKNVTVKLVNEIGEDTIVISATLLTALANNWLSLVSIVVVILIVVLAITKRNSSKKVKKYKRSK